MTKVRDLDQLLDVAARLFGELGYEATTLERIAQELGILKGSLYHYISSKAELHSLVTGRRLAMLVDEVAVIAKLDLPADERLERTLRAHLRTIDEFHPESSQWFVQPAPPRQGAANPSTELNRRYEHILNSIVDDGVSAGLFRNDLDSQVATLSMLGSCNWMTRWYRQGDRLSIEEIANAIITLALDGLRADGVAVDGAQRGMLTSTN